MVSIRLQKKRATTTEVIIGVKIEMGPTEVTKGSESTKRIDILLEAGTSNGDGLTHPHILGRLRPLDEGRILHINPEDALHPHTDTLGDRHPLEEDHDPHTSIGDRQGVRNRLVIGNAHPLHIDGGQGLPEQEVTAMV